MAVGVLVQLQRTAGGPRVVQSITEIQGMEGETVLLQDIFHRVDTADGMGRLVPTGLRPKVLDELSLSGVEVPPHIFRNEPIRDCSHLEAAGATTARLARDAPIHPPKSSTRHSRAVATRSEVDHAGCTTTGLAGGDPVAAVLVGAGLAIAVVAMLMRVRDASAHAGPDPRRPIGTAQRAGRGRQRVSRAR